MNDKVVKPKIIQSQSLESDFSIYSFMNDHSVGVLALVTEDGQPYAATIYFSINEDFEITFTSKEKTTKSQIIAKNKSAVLLVFDAASQSTVLVSGEAVQIHDFEDTSNAFDGTVIAAQKTSEDGIPPVSKIFAGKYEAYQLLPHQIKMSVFAAPDPGQENINRTIKFQY